MNKFVSVLLVFLIASAGRLGVAQVVSVRTVGAPTSSWFLPAEWSQGIPQNAGDVADVRLASGNAGFLSLGGAITLGQLLVSSTFSTGSFNLSGVGPLSFDGDAAPLLMRLTPQPANPSAILAANISTPLQWNGGKTLRVEAAPGGTWAFGGGISATSGDLVHQGGNLNLVAANTGWAGNLVIDGGTATASVAASLGTVAGSTTIKNGGRLVINNSTAESFIFDDGTLQLANHTLSGPITLAGSGTFLRLKNPPLNGLPQFPEASIGNTILSGAIGGSGDLTISNLSKDQVQITGSNDYSGHTYVLAGMTMAMNATSLGSAAGGTTVRGGMLSIRADMDEQFRVEGGELRFDSADYDATHAITMAGGSVYLPNRALSQTPIVVDGGGSVIVRGASWTGGATGVGDLTVGGAVDGTLAHDGDLTLSSAKLNAANSYTGATRSTGESEVNHAGAFGQSQEITVDGGTLRLNVLPNGTPEYVVRGGDLTVASSVGPIASHVTLGGGTIDAGIRGSGVYNGPIALQASGARTLTLGGGTFNGKISGNASIALGDGPSANVYLNAANEINGGVEVRAGNIHMNHVAALNLTRTNVSGGTLQVNVAAASPVIANGGTAKYNVDQEFAAPAVLHQGTYDAAAEVGLTKLFMLGGQSTYSKLQSSGGEFRIDDELVGLHTTQIDAKLTGDGVIRQLGYEMRINGDLSEFSGEISVERGALLLSPSAIPGVAPIHVRGDGQLRLSGNYELNGDIFLHGDEGTPDGRHASLTGGGQTVIRGRLDVGDGAAIRNSYDRIVIEGRLTGQNLDLFGGGVEINSMQSQLGGVLRATGDAGVNVGPNGGFHGLDEILLEDDSVLYFHPSQAKDRIGDSTVVAMRSGFLSIVSDQQTKVHETIGKLRIEPGLSRIAVSSDHGSLNSGLDLQELERQHGGVLEFIQSGWVSDTRIENFTPLANGMIGAWAFTERGFAVLDANREVQTLTPTRNTLAGAQAVDDVKLASPQTLVGDLTINTLDSEHITNAIDLGGSQLTVATGGVRQMGDISNGRITAGSGGDAELLLHRSGGRIGADVVDNGAGSVALVVSDSRTWLSGDNSYTGGTWVVGRGDLTHSSSTGQLFIENLSAIPENDRVFVDHGIYNVGAIAEGTIQLAELHLRNGGSVRGSNTVPIDADLIELQEGSFIASVTGDGDIRKTTDGHVYVTSAVSPNYTGRVTVEEGELQLNHDSLPQAQFVLEGGWLNFSGDGAIHNSITLDGGTLGGGNYYGVIDVRSDSSVYYDGPFVHLRGKLVGDGDLTIRGNYFSQSARYVGLFGDASEFTGDFQVAGGTFRVATETVSVGGGDFIVAEAGRLLLGGLNNSTPPLTIANDVHLNGGTLYSVPPSEVSAATVPHNTLTGNVAVHGAGFIGASRNGLKSGVVSPGLILAGQVALDDGAQVYGLSGTNNDVATGPVALVDVSGELLVGADATWNLLTSSLSISGTIRANAPVASINFVGSPDLLRMGGADVHVAAGQSLTIMQNGQSAPMAFSGAGSQLGGAGTIIGDVSVVGGAAISPGNSPGWLTIDGDVALGAGGILDVELAGTTAGVQYDVLQATGVVDLSGGMLDLSFLNGFTPTANDGFAILRAPSITGKFSNAPSSITVGDVTLPVHYRNQMVVLGNIAAVPEPACAALTGLGALAVGAIRRRLSRGR